MLYDSIYKIFSPNDKTVEVENASVVSRHEGGLGRREVSVTVKGLAQEKSL